MTTSLDSTEHFDPQEPIPGYRLIERIGSGGYGEVWKTEAPGGLAKAIKLVYGHRDERRAQREFKALERIKEVRHPFLLSMERIEIIDGRLVIVSELADSCLKKRFNACREERLPGIPREELLGYLQGAASALDYLSTEFSLQHLDVKPDNLLLVSGFVKVADFGLVKDLSDINCSMMDGLTPLYSPPELFDGRPSRRSDQYSLGVLYQELLTGVPPFLGRTAAQLASQHMHSRPTLDPLPVEDRETITKALSKNPENRFESCRELVDCLLDPSKLTAAAPVIAPPTVSAPVAQMESRDDDIHMTSVLGVASESADSPSTKAAGLPLRSLPSIDLDEIEWSPGPTFFIGVGGCGGQIVRHLRKSLVERLGPLENAPAIGMLALDTSCKDLNAAFQGDPAWALRSEEALAMPLRRSADYRNHSRDLLQWLSRRWLFNIPRTQQTEGLRPLGRLALADHVETVRKRIGQILDRITDPQSLNQSSTATGVQFENTAPRIFVVASIAGGTGSGMVLDLGYLIRELLAQRGLREDGLCSMLLHGTTPRTVSRELGAANTFSCLSELHHFLKPTQGYPGCPALKLAPRTDGTPPFTNTYLMHLGQELRNDQLEENVTWMAEYLLQNSVTEAGKFFAASRANRQGGPNMTVRTAGLRGVGCLQSNIPALATESLCKSLVESWRGKKLEGPTNKTTLSGPDQLIGSALVKEDRSMHESAQQNSEEFLLARGIELETLTRSVLDIAEKTMGVGVLDYADRVLQRLQENGGAETFAEQNGPAAMQILQAFNVVFGTHGDSSTTQEATANNLQAALIADLNERVQHDCAATENWVREVLGKNHRVKGAMASVSWMFEHLREMEKDLAGRIQHQDEVANNCRSHLLEPKINDQLNKRLRNRRKGIARLADLDPAVGDYAKIRLLEVALRGAHRNVSALRKYVGGHVERLREASRDLDRLSSQFADVSLVSDVAATADGQTVLADVQASIVDRLVELQADHMAELENRITSQRSGGINPLCEIVFGKREFLQQIEEMLRTAARDVVGSEIQQGDTTGMLLSASSDPNADDPLKICLNAAAPKLLACGGSTRLLLVIPKGSDRSVDSYDLESRCGQAPTVALDDSNNIAVCFEASGIPLIEAARIIINDRPEQAKLASRLRTRTDVAWSEF